MTLFSAKCCLTLITIHEEFHTNNSQGVQDGPTNKSFGYVSRYLHKFLKLYVSKTKRMSQF